jgi:hypothetical protein
MGANNPQIEQETIWGYTKEEIERRWLVYQKHDVVNRLFGSSKESPKKSAAPPVNNSEQMLSMLERVLSPADEILEEPETVI